VSSQDVEYRFPMPGAIEGSDWLLRFDGRVVELFNLYSGGSSRFPFPETRVVQTEPNKKEGGQLFYFTSTLLSSRVELYLRPDDVAKMDTLVDAHLANGAGTF